MGQSLQWKAVKQSGLSQSKLSARFQTIAPNLTFSNNLLTMPSFGNKVPKQKRGQRSRDSSTTWIRLVSVLLLLLLSKWSSKRWKNSRSMSESSSVSLNWSAHKLVVLICWISLLNEDVINWTCISDYFTSHKQRRWTWPVNDRRRRSRRQNCRTELLKYAKRAVCLDVQLVISS